MNFIKKPLYLALAAVDGASCNVAFGEDGNTVKDAAIEEVMITGTRIKRTDIESVGPVTVLRVL